MSATSPASSRRTARKSVAGSNATRSIVPSTGSGYRAWRSSIHARDARPDGFAEQVAHLAVQDLAGELQRLWPVVDDVTFPLQHLAGLHIEEPRGGTCA